MNDPTFREQVSTVVSGKWRILVVREDGYTEYNGVNIDGETLDDGSEAFEITAIPRDAIMAAADKIQSEGQATFDHLMLAKFTMARPKVEFCRGEIHIKDDSDQDVHLICSPAEPVWAPEGYEVYEETR